MAEKRGDQLAMGYENSDVVALDPYGTALDLTSYTDAKICAEISPDFSVEEVELSTIGCGGTSGFGTECVQGKKEYRVDLDGDAGYQNGFDRLLAQFMGESTVPVEQTLGQGDYLHTLTFSPQANLHFGTFAYESATASVVEMISTYVESVSITLDEVDTVLRYSFTLVSNDVEFSAPVNTNADLQSLAFINSSVIVPKCEHEFRIKAINDDGLDTALVVGDVYPITAFALEMSTPLEVVAEMTGGSCNAPTQSDKREGTLTIDIKVFQDNAFLSYESWKQNDKFMADLTLTGEQIGTGELLTFRIRFPKLCLVEAPDYSITDPGFNSYTLVFKLLDSNNVMPGFTTNGIEIDFINERSTEYLVA